MLQISSGILKGLQLKAPKGPQTRPTSVRLRQALFNFINHYSEVSFLHDAVVTDIFAGTGAFGIEALSHGAKEVWFVENHPQTLKILKENLTKALTSLKTQGFHPEVHILSSDILNAYKNIPQSKLVFCDPPYDKGWFLQILEQEQRFDKVLGSGLFLYEAHSKEKLPDQINTVCPALKLLESKNYGDSTVHFFVKT